MFICIELREFWLSLIVTSFLVSNDVMAHSVLLDKWTMYDCDVLILIDQTLVVGFRGEV